LISAVPDGLIRRSPAAGEWSALECLLHILDVEQVMNTRLQAFLAGRDFPAFNPDAEGSQGVSAPSGAELAEKFVRQRQASLDALAALVPADLDRKARHAELGPVTLDQMLNEWVTHDFNHTMQAEQAVMQPFLAACGPWQIYFQNHIIK
jgi:hypothetical protein